MKTSVCLAVVALALAGGCASNSAPYVTDERLDKGLVIILPGIEGAGLLSDSVRSGLLAGGAAGALAVHQWGRPIPVAGVLLNQVDVLGNRIAGHMIARKIIEYQDAHPDAPVYLVGHSGGGGIAVFAAEALPKDRRVDGLILLSPSISKIYDLKKALSRCRRGIVNFYSGADIALLVIGTTVMGNVDGIRGPAAGALGFDKHRRGLYQVPWQEEMSAAGNLGGHTDTAAEDFVAKFVCPWVASTKWPPGGLKALLKE